MEDKLFSILLLGVWSPVNSVGSPGVDPHIQNYFTPFKHKTLIHNLSNSLLQLFHCYYVKNKLSIYLSKSKNIPLSLPATAVQVLDPRTFILVMFVATRKIVQYYRIVKLKICLESHLLKIACYLNLCKESSGVSFLRVIVKQISVVHFVVLMTKERVMPALLLLLACI